MPGAAGPAVLDLVAPRPVRIASGTGLSMSTLAAGPPGQPSASGHRGKPSRSQRSGRFARPDRCGAGADAELPTKPDPAVPSLFRQMPTGNGKQREATSGESQLTEHSASDCRRPALQLPSARDRDRSQTPVRRRWPTASRRRTPHPRKNGAALSDYLRATVDFQVRHEAEAPSAVEESARLFEKPQGVPKDALDRAHAGAGTLSLGAPSEGGTLRIAQGSSECIT